MKNIVLKTVLLTVLALISTNSFAAPTQASWEIKDGKVFVVKSDGSKVEAKGGVCKTR